MQVISLLLQNNLQEGEMLFEIDKMTRGVICRGFSIAFLIISCNVAGYIVE